MTNFLDRLAGETRVRLLTLLRRSKQTIGALSEALRLTDNAVRTHVAALERDGFVEPVGAVRSERGKPPRLYQITPEGEELFPKAYAPVLSALVEEIAKTDGNRRLEELLRAVGQRAAGAQGNGDLESRVGAAAKALQGLGGDVEVMRTPRGWRIQGFGCPLSEVTANRTEVCEVARAMVEQITGQPVTECCEHHGRPRCAFELPSKKSHH